jgi:outer membrane protein
MKKNFLSVLLLVVFALNVYFFIKIKTQKENKIVYIDLENVFEHVELAKKYNQKVDEYQQTSQKVLDSLELEIKLLIQYKRLDLIESRKEEYFKKRNEFEMSYQYQTKKYSDLVMKQIIEESNQFRINNGYDMLFTKQKSSQLISADNKLDVTNEFITFVNNELNAK